MGIDAKLALKRRMVAFNISNDPFSPQFIKRQFYKRDPDSGSMIRDGSPITMAGFKSPVRIFENVKIERIEGDTTGIPVNVTETYLLAEYTEELVYGLIFDYHERKYMTLEPVWIIKYGDKVGRRCELLDITEEVVYAN